MHENKMSKKSKKEIHSALQPQADNKRLSSMIEEIEVEKKKIGYVSPVAYCLNYLMRR
jgi:hypothetical protein